MGNEVTNPRASAVGALAGLRSALSGVRSTIPETNALPFLRLLKDGDWVFGKDDHGLPKGSEAVVNVLSIKHGYTCWENKPVGAGKNELLGEVMEPVTRPLPLLADLPKHPYPWKMQLAVDLKVVGGKHDGKELHYKTSSEGGVRAMRGLIDAVLAQMDSDEEYVFPVIQLGADSYKHATYGRTYVPEIAIVGWANANGEEIAPDPEPGVETLPAFVTKPEPEPQRPTPTSMRAGRDARARELVEAEAQPEPDAAAAPARRRRT